MQHTQTLSDASCSLEAARIYTYSAMLSVDGKQHSTLYCMHSSWRIVWHELSYASRKQHIKCVHLVMQSAYGRQYSIVYTNFR